MLFKKGYIWLISAVVLFTGIILYKSLDQTKEFNPNLSSEKLDAGSIAQILTSDAENPSSAKISTPVFHLKSLDGSTHTIGEMSEKPVLINFWASWCEACHVEASMLNKLYDHFGDEIDFYGINIVTEESGLDSIQTFIEQYEISFPILLDEYKRAEYLYDLHAIPTSFLVDTNGNIVETFHLLSYSEFERKLEAFLSHSKN